MHGHTSKSSLLLSVLELRTERARFPIKSFIKKVLHTDTALLAVGCKKVITFAVTAARPKQLVVKLFFCIINTILFNHCRVVKRCAFLDQSVPAAARICTQIVKVVVCNAVWNSVCFEIVNKRFIHFQPNARL